MRPVRTPIRLLVVLAVVANAAACSGGGSDAPAASVSVPQVDFGPGSNVDGNLRPVPNGFAFPNFTAAGAPGNTFGGPDLAAMFGAGEDVCASGAAEACSPTAEAASWAQMVNESRQSGHCEGFIVQSLSRFEGGQTPQSADLSATTDVVQGIIRGFATQFIPEVRSESKGWRGTGVRAVLAELVTSLRDGTPDYVLGVYGDGGGHAVLPYAVEFPSAESARIQVYDSNWPGRNRFVDVDLSDDSWSFSFDGYDPASDPGAWSGGDGDMDLSSLDKRLTGTCPFCGDGVSVVGTMLTIRASAPTWTLDTARGQVSPSATVDGVDVTQTRAAITGVFEYVISIDPSAVDLTKKDSARLTLPPRSVAYAVTPAGIARAATSGTGGTIGLSETNVSSSSGTTEVRLAAGDEVIAAAGLAADISVEDGTVTGAAVSTDGKSVNAATDDENRAILLTVQGSAPVTRPYSVGTGADLPEELIGSVSATKLPPAAERELANITPDTPYVLPSVTTTTTTAVVTTTAAPAAAPTTVAGTATTKPGPQVTTTTVAATSGTTTTLPQTGVTTTAPATTQTTAPTTATTTATTAPPNQSPTISTFSCAQRSASTIEFTVVATDPEGSTLTVTFTDLLGNVWTSPATKSASFVSGSSYQVSRNQFGTADFQVRVNVSDGSNTATLTRTWDGDYVSNPSCTLVSTP